MKKIQLGFTLIELMIVITIIAVLASIAIPHYQDYVTRSKIMEGLSLSASAETAIAQSYQAYGYIPAVGNSMTPNSFDLPVDASISGKYVTKVNVAPGTGVITITYGAAVGGGVTPGDVLILTPITGAGSIVWACGNAAVTANGKTVGPFTTTTVPDRHLPLNCRG